MKTQNIYRNLFLAFSLLLITAGYNACSSDYKIKTSESEASSKAFGDGVSNDDGDIGQFIPDGATNVDDVDTVEEVDDAVDNHVCRDGGELDKQTLKVLICHIPPGNPSAQHELCVSVHALPALTGVKPTPQRGYLGHCLARQD